MYSRALVKTRENCLLARKRHLNARDKQKYGVGGGILLGYNRVITEIETVSETVNVNWKNWKSLAAYF